MSEIKFIVWDKNSKKMITESEYIQISGNGSFAVYDEGEGKWTKNGEDYSDLVLMQYTGLKDKNGKEIYEFDIITVVVNVPDGYDPMQDHEISHDEALKYKIEIDEDIIRIKLIPITEKDDPFGCNDYAWYLTDTEDEIEIEIIGNIYENPELLDA